MRQGVICMLIAALVLVAAGLVLLFWKGPRSSCPLRTRILTGIGAMAVSGALMGGGCALAFFTGNLSDQFANLAFAYEDYGFSYCFLQTWLNRGIRRPAKYSQKAVADIVRSVEEKTAALSADPQTDVNVIFIQLESYIDPSMIQGLELSEDPVPNWTALKEAYSSGYLTVPVVGAGTANTEFEVLTGMNMRFFGPGEYPYKTYAKTRTLESAASALKGLGYGAEALHNNGGNFYSRAQVFNNMGFDHYTSKEFMNILQTTPKGWATDDILVPNIMESMDTTEGQDFVFTVSVEGHGEYPTEKVLEDPEIVVSGVEDEGERNAWEYYVNLVHAMDEFAGDLVRAVEERNEPTVLVFYGDHLPTMNLEAKDLKSRYLYNTNYVIWDNIGLEKKDGNVAAYQVMADVFERLDIHAGTVFNYHQQRRHTKNYLADLELLQYDIMYGDQYVYAEEGSPMK